MMTNGDPKGRIFLSYPHTNNGLFFLLDILGKIAWVRYDFLSQVKISDILISSARTACLSAQSDQLLGFSLPGTYITHLLHLQCWALCDDLVIRTFEM